MNRIDHLFQNREQPVLSVYFTAGYPGRDDTREIILSLDAAGADMLEIGIPFSDPVADGPVIQDSSAIALRNGMSIGLLFRQLQGIRDETAIPLVLMGYVNPVLQYGMERFCADAKAAGIDGLIIPDLPVREYALHYKDIVEASGLHMIFLVTPATPADRLQEIDRLSRGFIYLVTAAGTTGGALSGSDEQQAYFEHIGRSGLTQPLVAGFGISNKQDFNRVCQYTRGAIVGSAFIRMLGAANTDLRGNIAEFVQAFR
ncbi:tryptophan synthase subunit alpha [Taibaiella chishuiensis]|uniref:Tryptophan synthase alpha chain n=1 Tax=Taibaiella chishuiensis TaxID=1434707 RepID=A0A2P8D5U5_9BACT|nr:tryptophan synthase subunit alpha [Taibaiella chishuiensis]PSK92559.1 tryptophan synthase alpha chain [Taibaiella chishuiensis]